MFPSSSPVHCTTPPAGLLGDHRGQYRPIIGWPSSHGMESHRSLPSMALPPPLIDLQMYGAAGQTMANTHLFISFTCLVKQQTQPRLCSCGLLRSFLAAFLISPTSPQSPFYHCTLGQSQFICVISSSPTIQREERHFSVIIQTEPQDSPNSNTRHTPANFTPPSLSILPGWAIGGRHPSWTSSFVPGG